MTNKNSKIILHFDMSFLFLIFDFLIQYYYFTLKNKTGRTGFYLICIDLPSLHFQSLFRRASLCFLFGRPFAFGYQLCL